MYGQTEIKTDFTTGLLGQPTDGCINPLCEARI